MCLDGVSFIEGKDRLRQAMKDETRKLLMRIIAVILFLGCLAVWIKAIMSTVEVFLRDRKAREVEDNDTEAKLSWAIHTNYHISRCAVRGRTEDHRMLALRA